MGQKVNPIGFRLGIYRDWDSTWFARNHNYATLLLEDIAIRKYIQNKRDFAGAEISVVKIEKTGDTIRVIIHAARPGVVIGKKGQEIDSLRKNLPSYSNVKM